MPMQGEIVIMPDGNEVRYLEMLVAPLDKVEEGCVIDDGVQCESEEIECGEQPGQSEVEQRQMRD